MITRHAIDPSDPSYAPLVTAGGFTFISHHGGDASLSSYADQTRTALAGLRDTLAAAGLEMSDVVQLTLWIREYTEEIDAAWDVFSEFFGDTPPARMTATTDFAEPERLVMLDGVAFSGR
ncbi:RidA family protein [Demequina salsinemoris]|uniref:RidA family protein n=1 Tax=Demequina salsinemoris TaxID=577470 RepID=UPI0007809023|nr:RidA family protein [Demequina salsinemoris]